MKFIVFFGLLAASATAHISIIKISIDGNDYMPFNAMVDPVIGSVRRIAWAYDHSREAHPNSFVVTESGTACGGDARPAKLIAQARAGSEVKFTWSQLIYMHQGPTMSYLGKVSNVNIPANSIQFFKIHEIGYDADQKKWANQMIYNNNNTLTIKLPSNIAPGMYVLKSDLISLHANVRVVSFFGGVNPQQYTQCFTLNITGDGDYQPRGTTFPPGYTQDEPGLTFAPYYGSGDGAIHNSKYPIPGPKVATGLRYDAPVGEQIKAGDPARYPPDIQAEYERVARRAELSNIGRVKVADIAWPKNEIEVTNFFKNIGEVYSLVSSAFANDAWLEDAKALAEKIRKLPAVAKRNVVVRARLTRLKR